MPSYDYRCKDCQDTFTIERSMTDNSETSCTGCESHNVVRIWNMILRSSGSTPDVGQGTAKKSSGGGCGSCSSHSCGTCH